MKTHVIYIAIILILFGGLFGALKYAKYHKDESNRKGQNIEALRSDTTERAVTITATRKELRTLFVQKDSLIRAFEKAKGGKVREVHTVTLHHNSVVHDTVEKIICPQIEPMQFYFPHGCLTSIVTYDPFYGTASDSLFGTITINRYLVSEKPRWLIFKPKYWFNVDSWPQSVRVEQNCGFEIKENTIIEIR